MRATVVGIAGFLASTFFLASCFSPYPEPPADDLDPGDRIGAEEERLFTPSTDSSGEPSFVFETSDPAYICETGYSLWAFKAAPQSPFVSRTVALNKLGGSPGAGYGLVFCCQGTGSGAQERMLVAMIDTKQEYIVGEALGSRFTAIIPWTYSSRLKYGYNQENMIGLDLDHVTKTFTLSINGLEVAEFTAAESDYGCWGGNGYIAVVSPQDDFPTHPVHIAYAEKP